MAKLSLDFVIEVSTDYISTEETPERILADLQILLTKTAQEYNVHPLWRFDGDNLSAIHGDYTINQYIPSLLIALKVLDKKNLSVYGGQYLYSGLTESGVIEIIAREKKMSVRIVTVYEEKGIAETRFTLDDLNNVELLKTGIIEGRTFHF